MFNIKMYQYYWTQSIDVTYTHGYQPLLDCWPINKGSGTWPEGCPQKNCLTEPILALDRCIHMYVYSITQILSQIWYLTHIYIYIYSPKCNIILYNYYITIYDPNIPRYEKRLTKSMAPMTHHLPPVLVSPVPWAGSKSYGITDWGE